MVVDNVKQATTTTAYANAVKGLSLEQAKLALSTKQLSALEKEQILIKAGLLNATGKLTTGQLTEILTNKQRNAEDAKALLLSTSLISAETAEATATNIVETAKLEELVATKQLTVAEAELIAMKAKVTTANIKEASTSVATVGKMSSSISILGSSVGSALTKIGSGLLSFASAHPIIAALTAVVGLVGITNSQLKKYEQEQQELIENAKSLQDEYRSFVQSSSDSINSLKNQADEFEKLSKGVTQYGENISLSADEYDRYKSIVAEVLGYTPELVDGYNAEGTAIANKNSLIERSIELMKEEQRQKLKEMTTDEKTGVAYEGAKAEWDDANAGYEGAHTRNEIARWFENNSTSNGWNYEVDIAKILGIKNEWSDEGNNLKNAIINNIDTVAENIKNKKAELLALEDGKGVALFTEAEIDNMIEKANDWEKAYAEWQQEIEDSKHGMDDQFTLYAQRADGYDDLTDAQRAFVSEYIKATGDIVDTDGKILSEDEMIEKAESYEKFVDKLATSSEFADARKKINELFALDSSTISAGEYEEQVNNILKELQTKFELTDDEVKDFKIALGFDFIEDGSSTRVSELVEKVQGKLKDDFDDKALDLSLDDLIIASNLEVPKDAELSWEDFIKLLNEAKDIPPKIDVLSFKDAFNAEDFKDTKENLLELAKSGELTPYTLSSTKEYKTLLDQTGLTAEQVYKKIMKVAKGSMDATDWQTTLDNSRKNIIALKEMKNSLSEDGISAVSSDVVSNYPELIGCLESETDLRKGINGLISDYETKAKEAYFNLVQDSESYYSNLKKNESAKLNTASKTINAIVNANKTLVSQLGGAYNVDLKNFKSVAQAKAQLEQQLIINSAKAWSKYYKVQLDASKNTAKVVANGDFNSGGTGGSDSIKAYEEASKAQNAANASAKAYNEAINSLKNITYDTVLPEITNPSGDTDKATKSTTKFSQAIDWCAQTLSKLSKTIDLYSAKLENNTNSVKTQIKYYKELLNAQNNIVKGYSKTESKYKSTYNKALKKLSKSDQKKVKDGTYTIEQFSGTTKKSGKKSKAEKRYNNIQKALEARDNYLDAQTDSVNAKNQLQEYAEELASVRWDKAAEQVEKLNNQISVLDTRMSNVSGYKAKNEVLSEQLKLQKKILTKQENAYANTQSDANSVYKKISSKYKKNMNSDGTIKTKGVTNQTQLKYIKEYNAYVKELAKDEIELAQAQEDYTAAVQEAAVARAEYIKTDYDNKISLIDAKANQLDSQISLAEAKGQVASVEFYKQLQNNSNQRKTELEAEKKALQKQLANTRAYTDEWYEVKQMVIEVDEAIADETVNAVENINKQIEAVEALTKAKNDYLSGSISTNDWLESLTDEDDYYNEDGSFSDKGLAVVKSKLNNISLYEQQAKNSQDNLNNLDEKLANGEITEAEYETKRLEYINDLQDATKSMYDEQQSLHDMYINGLKEESEALQELIDKKMESLKADKAEYDYQKSITEKTKNITDLEKQLAMLEGDNSEEARAKRQKVKVELEEAQQDLEDTQYDKYLERLENSLGDLQDRFDAVIDKLDKQGAIPSIEELQKLTDDNASDVTKGVDKIIKEAGLDKLLGEEGIGSLNKTTAELLSTPSTGISDKITATNKWLNKIYTALSDGSSGTTEEDVVSIAEALGTYDSKNKTADTSGKSALNKYIMSQGYSAMDEEQMVTLKDAILNSKYSEGMDASLKETLTNITSANNLTKGKDANYSDNKNAILKAYKYTKANEFISKNATKATKKQSEYGILNKKIYDITGGKVLSKEDTLGLGNIFNVKDSDNSGGINGNEAKKLVKLLENAGFANGGIVEKAIHNSGDDGIAKLKVGEAVLTPVQTTAFTKLAENIVPFNNLIGDIVERPNIPTVDRGASMTSTSIDNINVEFSLPNVTDKESFKDWLQNDGWINRYFDSMITNKTVGGNKRFGTNRL